MRFCLAAVLRLQVLFLAPGILFSTFPMSRRSAATPTKEECALKKLEKQELRSIKNTLAYQKNEGASFLQQFAADHPSLVPAVEKFARSLLKTMSKKDAAEDVPETFGRGTTYICQINKRFLGELLVSMCPGMLGDAADSLAQNSPDDITKLFLVAVGIAEGKARISDVFSSEKLRSQEQSVQMHRDQGTFCSGASFGSFTHFRPTGRKSGCPKCPP